MTTTTTSAPDAGVTAGRKAPCAPREGLASGAGGRRYNSRKARVGDLILFDDVPMRVWRVDTWHNIHQRRCTYKAGPLVWARDTAGHGVQFDASSYAEHAILTDTPPRKRTP